ncbi:MAG: extracellular solute-binding protein [Lachnospiraceae bacterium]|nr:MAG: extracellular solute-binding protein [Lachnospiraceae bacterium]
MTHSMKNREGSAETDADSLVVYSPHPLDFINPIVSEFEAQTGISVQVRTGGTGELLKWAREGDEPVCDVFWGGSLYAAGAGKDLFEPYISENEEYVREEFKNKEGNMTRFTDIPSVLMVNTNLLGGMKIQGYEDLLDERLKGKIAMCDPSTSSSASEHLINMLYAMGEGNPEKGWDYVEKFCKNLDGMLLKSSSEVYQGVAEGRYTVGLTFEEGGAGYVSKGAPVKLIYMKEGVISTPDVVCIVKGSRHKKAAEEYVDFVTGKAAQTVIADSLDRRSVRKDVEAAAYLPDKEEIHMITADENMVNEKREQWKQRFTEIFTYCTQAETCENESAAGSHRDSIFKEVSGK